MKFNTDRLRAARFARGHTLDSLGEATALGPKTISKIENETQCVSMEQFEKFCEMLQVSPNFLMGGSSFAELDEDIRPKSTFECIMDLRSKKQ